MGLSAPLGICSAAVIGLDCDGNIDPLVTPIVMCSMNDFQLVPVLSDGLTIQEDSGVPGRRCIDIEIDPYTKWYDVTITTCSIYDPRVDALFGYSDLIVDPVTNKAIGSKAQSAGSQACVCDCGDEACKSRAALMLWSLNLCPNAEGVKQLHPDGRSWLTILPAIQFRHTTNPIVQLNNQTQGRQYTGRTYTNPNFGRGPSDIIPASQIPLDRAWYQFPSDVCPPGGCSCGTCGGDGPPFTL